MIKKRNNNILHILINTVLFTISLSSCGGAASKGGSDPSGDIDPPIVDVRRLQIIDYPLATSYEVGESFSLDGLVVIDSFTEEVIDDYQSSMLEGYNFKDEDVGEKQVYITKEGYTSTFFTISISSKVVPPSVIKYVDIYATNDIHGQVISQNGRASIGKVMSYLKEKKTDENTLLLDQGDTWQGMIYSNFNHGEMITDLMNYVHYDARTVGNHDFDWGVNYIVNNGKREFDGYKTPVLAANVYDFDFVTKEVGDEQQKDIGTKSVCYTLENGLKVGIIGTIGLDQITSICSLYTQDIAFIDHISVIKEEAIKLRNDGCNIVISCCHAGQESLLGNGLEDYIDLSLCAHTHKNVDTFENGLYYAQFGSYNQLVGHIQLSFNTETKEVNYTLRESISGNTIERQTKVDTEIERIVNQYNEECETEANVVIANNVTGPFYSSTSNGELPNLMCKAIYDTAVKEGHDVDIVYVNQARASLYDSYWTYADIYQAFPFDNNIYIFEASYDEIRYEIAPYNSRYCPPSFSKNIERGKKYKVACIDYLLFHTNSNRYYDYFSDNNGRYITTLSKNYRLILKDWLINNEYQNGKPLLASDYSPYLSCFSGDFNYI